MQNSTKEVKQHMPNSVKNGVGYGQKKKFQKNGWMNVCDSVYLYDITFGDSIDKVETTHKRR